MAEHDAFAHIQPKKFVVDLHIDGKMERSYVTALDRESLMAHLSIVVALNLARIPGYVVYNEQMEVLASVNATEFMVGIKSLQKAPPGGKPGVPSSQAGQTWSAVPVVTPTSDDFQKAMDARRRPQDAHAEAASAPRPHPMSPPQPTPTPSAPPATSTDPKPTPPGGKS